MRRWIRGWLRAWRSEPLVLVSPLPVEVVRARLAEGSVSYLRAAFMFAGGGGYRVVGRVGARRISMEAGRAEVRNAWRPTVRGRLEAEGTGSKLVGTLGWSPFVKAFSALWLGIVICAFAVLPIAAANLAVCLVPLGFMAFFVALTAWGIRAGRSDASYLRSWLADRMQTAEAGIPGYRPR